MNRIVRAFTVAGFTVAIAIASVGVTSQAEAFPNIFSVKGVSGMDLGSGR